MTLLGREILELVQYSKVCIGWSRGLETANHVMARSLHVLTGLHFASVMFSLRQYGLEAGED